METRINVAKILANCPRGMELDCAMFNEVYFDCIEDSINNPYPIRCYRKVDDETLNIIRFSEYGAYTFHPDAKCIIFPKSKPTWEGFLPPCKFKDGDIVCTTLNSIAIIKEESGAYYTVYCGANDDAFYLYVDVTPMRLATEEERQKLFDVIKKNGYKWDAEKKCLIELPKFKNGDILAAGDWVFIFKELHTNGSPRCYCHYDLTLEEFKVDTNSYMAYGGDICLATKEQQDLLFSKMKGAGYKWNAEKKCLEKLAQYPKTYKECCDILGLNTMANDAQGYKWDLIIRMQELIICRDAYWKFYSEQMRLDYPWQPDYRNGSIKFCIRNVGCKFEMTETIQYNTILAFPSKEMRDAFYENFKEDIERINELL